MRRLAVALAASLAVSMLTGASNGTTVFNVDLTGEQEVPRVFTQTEGKAQFKVNKAQTQIEFDVKIKNAVDLLAVAGAHLHCAPVGSNGPVVAFLATPVGGGLDGDVRFDGTLDEGSIINPACGATISELAQSMQDGDVYVNVHSKANPGGEVRGQVGVKVGKSKDVELRILAINDFHGNIDTASSSFGGTGGADFLATNIDAARSAADNSIFVSAGDLIGASPLISALFHDEPTIEAMNLIGLDINAVGNHEFDEGPAELLRMQNGGSHPVDGDLDGDGFAGADFEFLAANVIVDDTGETLFPAVTIRKYEGVDVAFIGMTLEGTPTIVTPSGVEGLTFLDEVETANALVEDLQDDGIESIVVLLHEGGFSNGGQDDCGTQLTGPVADIAAGLDSAVDLVIAGHTNDEFVCEIDGKWVTMADNRGRLYTQIDVTLDKKSGDMTVVRINNKSNLRSVDADADVRALIDKYEALSAPLANMVIGTITADILRANNAAGESALGDVIADAQLDATDDPGFGDAVVAFMNPGGIRDDLLFAPSGPELPGEVTFGEAFSVQPFGNSLVTMTLTGAQIHDLLEEQWDGQPFPRILQPSAGFTYEWSAGAPDGDKVDPASIKIGGVTVVPGDSYRVTVNSFLADGGDNFDTLVLGTDRLGGEVDLDALVTYFGANSPVPPGPQDRIVRIP